MRRYKYFFCTCILAVAVFVSLLVGIRTTKAFSTERKMDGIEEIGQCFADFRIPAEGKIPQADLRRHIRKGFVDEDRRAE